MNVNSLAMYTLADVFQDLHAILLANFNGFNLKNIKGFTVAFNLLIIISCIGLDTCSRELKILCKHKRWKLFHEKLELLKMLIECFIYIYIYIRMLTFIEKNALKIKLVMLQ